MNYDTAKKCTMNTLAYLTYAPNFQYCQEYYGRKDEVAMCKKIRDRMLNFSKGMRENCDLTRLKK